MPNLRGAGPTGPAGSGGLSASLPAPNGHKPNALSPFTFGKKSNTSGPSLAARGPSLALGGGGSNTSSSPPRDSGGAANGGAAATSGSAAATSGGAAATSGGAAAASGGVAASEPLPFAQAKATAASQWSKRLQKGSGERPPAEPPAPSAALVRQASSEIPPEVRAALSELDDGLVAVLKQGAIRLVRAAWLLAQPDEFRMVRRQKLEEIEQEIEQRQSPGQQAQRQQSPGQQAQLQQVALRHSPLLSPDEAVTLIRRGDRSVGVLSYPWLCACRTPALSSVHAPRAPHTRHTSGSALFLVGMVSNARIGRNALTACRACRAGARLLARSPLASRQHPMTPTRWARDYKPCARRCERAHTWKLFSGSA